MCAIAYPIRYTVSVRSRWLISRWFTIPPFTRRCTHCYTLHRTLCPSGPDGSPRGGTPSRRSHAVVHIVTRYTVHCVRQVQMAHLAVVHHLAFHTWTSAQHTAPQGLSHRTHRPPANTRHRRAFHIVHTGLRPTHELCGRYTGSVAIAHTDRLH